MHEDEYGWRDFALCQGARTNNWFDDYEDDDEVAKNTDDVCLSCPVRKSCLAEGVRLKATGCWGGVYLINGRMDEQRNAHKTQDIWEQVMKL